MQILFSLSSSFCSVLFEGEKCIECNMAMAHDSIRIMNIQYPFSQPSYSSSHQFIFEIAMLRHPAQHQRLHEATDVTQRERKDSTLHSVNLLEFFRLTAHVALIQIIRYQFKGCIDGTTTLYTHTFRSNVFVKIKRRMKTKRNYEKQIFVAAVSIEIFCIKKKEQNENHFFNCKKWIERSRVWSVQKSYLQFTFARSKSN